MFFFYQLPGDRLISHDHGSIRVTTVRRMHATTRTDYGRHHVPAWDDLAQAMPSSTGSRTFSAIWHSTPAHAFITANRADNLASRSGATVAARLSSW